MHKEYDNPKLIRRITVEEYLSTLDKDIGFLDLSYMRLESLPDLSRFNKINELNCVGNKLKTLIIPPSVTILNCSFNQIAEYPTFHDNLEYLLINSNKLQIIDNINPNLKYLRCNNNLITNINIPVNSKLDVLICDNNKIDRLPLTDTIKSIYINNNNLSGDLVIVSNLLTELVLYNNNITSLDIRHTSVENLDITDNPLSNLVINDNLQDLFVDRTKLVITNKDLILRLQKIKHRLIILKYKERLLDLLYNVKENKGKLLYHPSRLALMLEINSYKKYTD